MKNSRHSPIISVCIPVFSTEPLLEQCLRSVIEQDFEDFEVVIVSDDSRGKDSKGRSAKKIVRFMQKECDKLRKAKKLPRVPLRFVEHKENRGLIEVRRTLCYEARGFYMTQLDSDDEMESGALSALYKVAVRGVAQDGAVRGDGFDGVRPLADGLQSPAGGARSSSAGWQPPFDCFDIVHGTSTAGVFDESGVFHPAEVNRYGTIFYGEIEGREVFRKWLLEGAFTANTWGKLIKRELWVKAYENIPYTQCNMADDVLLFFFLGQYAKSYIGIKDKVYRYRMNTGMSSHRKIDTVQKWRMVCSAASVFSVISTWISENQIAEDEVDKMRAMTRHYLVNNIKQMKETVVPELQEKAHEMLCEYWGENFVAIAEKAMSEK